MQSQLLAVVLLAASVTTFCDAIIVHRDDPGVYKAPDRTGTAHDDAPGADDGARAGELNFHEVDALGDDFVDFGAQTGPHGAFSWHANFPIEDS